jgi:phosphonate ABC transporter permease subunit PhnE
VFLLFGSVTAARKLDGLDQSTIGYQVRRIVNLVLLVVVAVLVLGLLSGVFIWIGTWFKDGLPGQISNLFAVLGTLGELLIAPIAALASAFTLASIGTRLGAPALRGAAASMGHLSGAALGVLAGGVLFYGLAVIGAQAALLGILTPVVAAVLGAQCLPLVYRRWLGGGQAQTMAAQTVTQLLAIGGAVAAFILTLLVLEIPRTISEGRLPSYTVLDSHLILAALIGAALGGLMGGIAGVRAAFPLGLVIYNTTRTILNILRSIEPLIMGLVFVSWVGIGPFAGLLALTLHSIASLGKLYSEQIESIDAGPIEAIQATGANRLQTIIYAVVPQIVPPYIAFTMYRWDINVRMSTIIGFVGGGGIGFLLQQQINLLQYRDAGVAVLAIAIVVSILDYASAALRERVV